MSVTTPCSENIPSETLSAWGDGGLPEAEAARLRAHTAGCPACQERLRAYGQVSQLMRGQRIPAAPPVDVAAVRAGRSQLDAPRRLRRGMPRTVWGGLGAVVAAALLIAAFSQVFAHLGPITPATATATATRPTIKTLVWSQRTLPPGISLGLYPINFSTQADYEMNFAISHASSQNGWVCALAPDGTVTIWATTDQARTWRRIGSITSTATPTPINGCYLVPDQVSPITLAIGLTWGDGAKGTLQMESYISGNDGQTWTSLGSVSTPALATIGKRTYVITISRQSPHTRLMVSDEGYGAWRDITPANPTFQLMTTLWPDPASGALLLGAGQRPPSPEAPTQLWRSDDGGATWTQYDPKYEVYMGAWLSTAHHWRLCAEPSKNIASYMCTDDLGKTWNPVPTPSALTVCSDCGRDGAPDTLQAACPGVTLAIALDGSLLSDCLAPGSYTKATLPAAMVYQLAPGSTAWKDIGPISGPWGKDTGFEYSALFLTADPSSSAGALWYADPVAKALAVGVLPS